MPNYREIIAKHRQQTGKSLDQMTSTELEKLSAEITAMKDLLRAEYTQVQFEIQHFIGPAQEREMAERNKDPVHAAKHQGVGMVYGKRRGSQ